VIDGALRTIRWRGVEVVRGIACPIRDENWGTHIEQVLAESADEHGYTRAFTVAEGKLHGRLTAQFVDDGTLRVVLELRAMHAIRTNRAGFTVLHPIASTAGQPLRITHDNGTIEHTNFPDQISPGQPAFDIAGLGYSVDGVAVHLEFGGEIFEMEDQRNWTDASYKTYCRPLSLPYPYTLNAGEAVSQSITLRASGTPTAKMESVQARTIATKPELLIAMQAGWHAEVHGFENMPALIRLQAHERGHEAWVRAACSARTVDLEVIVPAGVNPQQHLAMVARELATHGIAPRCVIALPEPYLKSYQPTAKWPDGPTPSDAAWAAHAAFPRARIGVGVLANFTELNRCRPAPDFGDYLTFSTTAIVHAADDRSVRETLEALPQVFSSARTIAGGRPIRLGLVSIGMRSNPYGADVAANPHGQRIAMAQYDPRQATAFAAEFAREAYAIAAREGIEAIALTSLGGPFGLGGGSHPIAQLLRELQRTK
jgi:hypothetical protein